MIQERSKVDPVASMRQEHRVAMRVALTPVNFERSLQFL